MTGYDIIERTGQAECYLREARRAGLPLPPALPCARPGAPAVCACSEDNKPAQAQPRPAEFDIIERTGQAEYYLREARRAGLPLPGYVTIGAHNHGAWTSSAIRFQLASDYEVGEWAAHFGCLPVTEPNGSSVTIEGSGHHDVQAYHYEKTEAAAAPGTAS